MKLNPESLARASSRHPWRVLIGWVVLVMACGAFVGAGLGDVLTTDIAFTNKPESIQAQDVIDQKFGGGQQENTEYVIVLSKTATVDDPAFQAYVTDLQGVLAGSDLVASPPATYYDVVQQSPGAGGRARVGGASRPR